MNGDVASGQPRPHAAQAPGWGLQQAQGLDLGGNQLHATRRARGDVALSSLSGLRNCGANGYSGKLCDDGGLVDDWLGSRGETDEGGAQTRFRLGGACACELSRWVNRGHRDLGCEAARKIRLSWTYDKAKTFDQLTPEESKERLGKIVSKIDGDKDGFVTVDELKDWIKFAQKRWIYEDVERQWKGHDLNEDGLVSWEEYKNATYGYVLDKIDADKDGFVTEGELKTWIKHAQKKYIYDNVENQWQEFDMNQDGLISWDEYRNVTYGTYLDDPDPDDGFNYKQMMVRDERRFKMADKDGDLIATKEEFTAFLHPEEYDYMKDIVVQETMEDIDKNADGFIDLEEYIGDMYSHDGNADEPEWVKTEREQFVEFRDKNRDGKMDKEETKDWILPSDYDHAEAEARHLVYESDQNKDGKLTKEEIVDKYDLFVGSQATDFGEALVRHDEF
ncbi:Hypothetical predicted protein [Marmota monax]|uniref:Reticulocalbin-3 n=1 Tax=Marmota monax TaxID=9995 RepID=A0A5E4BT11_MARMO|nr:calumenin [Marmota monax]VTJ72758.1 Hypothetical predicted protein [Marmota monax]